MPLLVQCPHCKKLHGPKAKKCESRSGKGCGKNIPSDRKIYYAQWRDPNGRVKQKKIGPYKEAALNFLRKVETAVCEGCYIEDKKKPKVTISKFCEEQYRPWCETYNRGYKTKLGYINVITEEFGSKYLEEIGDQDIDKLRRRMIKERPVMFNRVLATLSHLYTIAIEYGYIDAKPFNTRKKRIKETNRLRYLLPDEATRLLDACTDHLRPVVEVALHTGLRRGELLSLRLGREVNLEERMISLGIETKTKNNEIRYVPLNDTAYNVLRQAAEGKKIGDHIFTWKGKELTSVKRSWASALRAAEVEDFHFHDLRHTFASNLAMQGVDLLVLKELLGHKDIKMTLKYAHLSPDHRAKAVSVLDEVFSQGARNICENSSSICQSSFSSGA